MGNVKSLAERSRIFEEAHCSCRELMEDQLQSIEDYASKWLLIGLAVLLLVQILGFSFFYYKFTSEFTRLEEQVDYRYSLTMETLEDIYKVKIEEGKVVSDYSKPVASSLSSVSK